MCAVAAMAAARAAGAPSKPVLWAGSGALAAGLLDDVFGGAGDRGLRGHGRALRRGRLTTGAVKAAVLGIAGLVAGAAVGEAAGKPAADPAGSAVSAGCVALAANLVNLFDLRPGRALKATLIISVPVAVLGPVSDGAAVLAGVASAALGALPMDLAERGMLGDTGANTLGALAGLGLATSGGRRCRIAVLAGCAALTAASEWVSFSRLIDGARPVRWLDGLGRLPAGPR